MASNRTTDLTWRTDGGGTPIMSQRGELILNKIEMLLNLIPGKDPSDPERGLNVRTRMSKTYVSPTRDTEFETDLVNQITKYTDMSVTNAMVVHNENIMYIYLEVVYQGQTYALDIKVDDTTLTSKFRNPEQAAYII